MGTHTPEDGHSLLSSRLMSDIEIDEVVENMKIELVEFRKKAKKELKMLKEKM